MSYDPAKILANRRYVVRARIVVDNKPLFMSDTGTPVITGGNPTSVSMMLRRVGTGQTTPPNPLATKPLEGTYWRAIELAGKPTPTQDAKREAYLVFQPGGRLSGSDGCNRLRAGTNSKKVPSRSAQWLAHGWRVSTQQPKSASVRESLKRAMRLTTAGDRLDLFDAAGNRIGAFTAVAQASTPPAAAAPLGGTSWQLVNSQGSDDTTLTPDDRENHTVEFGAAGQLTARVDCDPGRGTWKSAGANQVQFGPLALTRAKCPAGSLHDHIVKQWTYIRSYVTREGHLFLSLMADGGIYEFEPMFKP